MSKLEDVRAPKPVTINLGGEERELQFDMNAYAELEKRYGSVEKAMNTLQQGKMSDLRIVLWAGLIHNQAVLDEFTGEPIRYNLTPYQVGSWIKSAQQLEEVGNKLAEVMTGSMPDNPENTEETKNQ